jgi:hypothetical protein
MMKMGKISIAALPALLIAGMPVANASTLDDLLCKFFGWGCGPSGGGPGGGPVSASEPEMIALFSVGLIAAGIAAYRRRRK